MYLDISRSNTLPSLQRALARTERVKTRFQASSNGPVFESLGTHPLRLKQVRHIV
jgi:hypothetical protein